jgi:hypothetical protein
MAGFLKKAISFVSTKLIPAAVALGSGNIGASASALFKKKEAATVGNTAQTTQKPSLILGYETQNGIAKADFTNSSAEIVGKKSDSTMLYAIGGLAALFGVYAFSRKK